MCTLHGSQKTEKNVKNSLLEILYQVKHLWVLNMALNIECPLDQFYVI